MFARRTFFLCLFAAAPGMCWHALEMYGLTLFGPQMLFFSIAHTMPLAVLLVVLAVPFMLALFVQSAIGLGRPTYRARMGVTKRALLAVVVYFPIHALLLGTYEIWSPTPFRVPLCLSGLALMAAASTALAMGSGEARKVEANAL